MAAPYSLQLVPKEGYLHALIGGENTPEVTRRYVRELIDACRSANCPAVLVEEHLEGPRMRSGELFWIIQELHADFRSAIQLAAFVDASAERSDDNMRFVEDASVNRGAGVAGFRTVAEAEAWLRAQLSKP